MSGRRTAAATACLLVFVALTVLVGYGVLLPSLDAHVRNLVGRWQDPALRSLALTITDLLSPGKDATVLVVVSAWLSAWTRRIRPLLVALAALAVLALTVLSVKAGIDRPSPHLADGGHGGYFPSGHTASTLVCYGTVAVLIGRMRPRWRRWLGWTVGVVTVAVAGALVYDSYHWLSDTVAAIFLGVAILIGIEALGGRASVGRPQTADSSHEAAPIGSNERR